MNVFGSSSDPFAWFLRRFFVFSAVARLPFPFAVARASTALSRSFPSRVGSLLALETRLELRAAWRARKRIHKAAWLVSSCTPRRHGGAARARAGAVGIRHRRRLPGRSYRIDGAVFARQSHSPDARCQPAGHLGRDTALQGPRGLLEAHRR